MQFGGAAAAADDVDAELAHEAVEPVREVVGLQWEVGVLAARLRQAGVGHHANQARTILRQVLHARQHQIGADGAVEADDIDAGERFERDECARDVGAGQHLLVGLHHSNLHHQRQLHAARLHHLHGGDGDGFGLQNIKAGLD